jgi:hypothetical protein
MELMQNSQRGAKAPKPQHQLGLYLTCRLPLQLFVGVPFI